MSTRTATDEAQEIRASLQRPLPEIPSKYLYDDRGSELFERITHLPEYYQTRTELGILERYGDEVVRAVSPRELVELGSGAGRKVRILLDANAEIAVPDQKVDDHQVDVGLEVFGRVDQGGDLFHRHELEGFHLPVLRPRLEILR